MHTLSPGSCAIILKEDGGVSMVAPKIKSRDETTPPMIASFMVLHMLQDPNLFSIVRDSFIKAGGQNAYFDTIPTDISINRMLH